MQEVHVSNFLERYFNPNKISYLVWLTMVVVAFMLIGFKLTGTNPKDLASLGAVSAVGGILALPFFVLANRGLDRKSDNGVRYGFPLIATICLFAPMWAMVIYSMALWLIPLLAGANAVTFLFFKSSYLSRVFHVGIWAISLFGGGLPNLTRIVGMVRTVRDHDLVDAFLSNLHPDTRREAEVGLDAMLVSLGETGERYRPIVENELKWLFRDPDARRPISPGEQTIVDRLDRVIALLEAQERRAKLEEVVFVNHGEPGIGY